MTATADVQKARSETTGPFDSRRIVRLDSLPHEQRRAISESRAMSELTRSQRSARARASRVRQVRAFPSGMVRLAELTPDQRRAILSYLEVARSASQVPATDAP